MNYQFQTAIQLFLLKLIRRGIKLMSFITQSVQLTDNQRADASARHLLMMMKQKCQEQFDIAWHKWNLGKKVVKTLAESQSFFDGLGVKAALSMDLHSDLQELIYKTDNSWTALVPPYNYVKNVDGTVTLSLKE